MKDRIAKIAYFNALSDALIDLKVALLQAEGVMLNPLVLDGGEGSGNFNHEGRPGKVGGSGEGSGSKRKRTSKNISIAEASQVSGFGEEKTKIKYLKDELGFDDNRAYKTVRAIERYTSQDSYDIRHKVKGYTGMHGYISSFLDEAPLYDGVVYKGKHMDREKLDKILKTGEFDMPMIESWSNNIDIASSFSNAENPDDDDDTKIGVLFRLEKPKSAVGARMLSAIAHEHEILMPENRKYKVLDVKKSFWTMDVFLEELSNPKNPARDSAIDGGKGSGNFGHKGRPGEVGGSSSEGGSSSRKTTKKNMTMNMGDLYAMNVEDKIKMRWAKIVDDIGVSEDRAMDIEASMRWYSSYSSYEIRHEENDSYKIMNSDISEYLEKAPILEGEIFKGKLLGFDKMVAMYEAEEFEMPMIESWTQSTKHAEHFAKVGGGQSDTQPVVFHMKENKAGVGVAMLSVSPKELEVLTPKNRKYKILSVVDAEVDGDYAGYQIVEVEDVTPSRANDLMPDVIDGGVGSGNFNHKGRPGEVGGSSSTGGGGSSRPRTSENPVMDDLISDGNWDAEIGEILTDYIADKTGVDKARALEMGKALVDYTEGSSYRIRHKTDEFYAKFNDSISEYLEKAPLFDETIHKGKMVRAEKFEQLENTDIIQMPMIESWTQKINKARDFTTEEYYNYTGADMGEKPQPVIFTLKEPKSAVGIACFSSNNADELEVLTPSNRTFKIIERSKRVGLNFYTLEEVDSTAKDSETVQDGGEV